MLLAGVPLCLLALLVTLGAEGEEPQQPDACFGPIVRLSVWPAGAEQQQQQGEQDFYGVLAPFGSQPAPAAASHNSSGALVLVQASPMDACSALQGDYTGGWG